MEPHSPAKPRRSDPFVLIAICVSTLIFGLGGLALIGPDEPRYAEVAREMFAGGDYISTRLCGCLWFEKPALLYWLAAAGYRLFGVGEFGARIPSAVAAFSVVLGLYFWLKSMTSREIAVAAALVLSTSGLFIAYARVVAPDMLLTASMTLSLMSIYQASRPGVQPRLVHWGLFGLGLALSMLAKGLAGVVLTPLIVGVYSAIRRDWKWITWRGLLTTFLIFTVVSSVWYAPVVLRHGNEFIVEFFGKHHFQRYVSNVYGHPQPFYFFVVVAIMGMAPWSLFLIPAVLRLRDVRSGVETRQSLLVFAWSWVVVPLLFFSFSGSKLPGYILPIVPALAIILSNEIAVFCGGERKLALLIAAWGTGALTIILGGMSVFFANREAGPSGWRLVLSFAPLIFSVVAAGCLGFGKRQAFFESAAAVVAAIVVSTVIVTFDALNDQLSLKRLSLEAAAALKPNERICFFIKKEFAPVFYAQGRVVCGIGEMDILNALREDILASALEQMEREGIDSVIVITTENWREGLENYPRFETSLVARQASPALRLAFARRDSEAALAFRVSLRH